MLGTDVPGGTVLFVQVVATFEPMPWWRSLENRLELCVTTIGSVPVEICIGLVNCTVSAFYYSQCLHRISWPVNQGAIVENIYECRMK